MTAEDKMGTGEAIKPSVEAMAAAEQFEEWCYAIQATRTPAEPSDYTEQLTLSFDAFAQKAVEARVARIVAALEARKQTAAITHDRAVLDERYTAATRANGMQVAFDEAIAIAKGEEPTP